MQTRKARKTARPPTQQSQNAERKRPKHRPRRRRQKRQKRTTDQTNQPMANPEKQKRSIGLQPRRVTNARQVFSYPTSNQASRYKSLAAGRHCGPRLPAQRQGVVQGQAEPDLRALPEGERGPNEAGCDFFTHFPKKFPKNGGGIDCLTKFLRPIEKKLIFSVCVQVAASLKPLVQLRF